MGIDKKATLLDMLILRADLDCTLLQHTASVCKLIPEIRDMIGFEQNNPHHHLDVWQHTVMAINNASIDLIIRLTMLFHDIAKPRCYTEDENGGHFYGHPQINSNMAKEILLRLGHDGGTIETVAQLVLYHDVDIQPRRKHIKRWIYKIGEERFRQLIQVKRADAMAQSETYHHSKLSALDAVLSMFGDITDQQLRFSVKNLAINGRDLINVGVPQGVKIGSILNHLMDMVTDSIVENERERLLAIASKFICEQE